MKSFLNFYHKNQTGINPQLRNALTGVAMEMKRPVGIISGHRTASHNKMIGGARKSHHVKRNAADIDLSGMTDEQRKQAVREATQRGAGGFISYSKLPNILHVDTRETASGRPHFMHDRSSRNMDNAPSWMREAAAANGLPMPANVPIPTNRPGKNAFAGVTPDAPQEEPIQTTFAPETAPPAAQNAISSNFAAPAKEKPMQSPFPLPVQPQQEENFLPRSIFGLSTQPPAPDSRAMNWANAAAQMGQGLLRGNSWSDGIAQGFQGVQDNVVKPMQDRRRIAQATEGRERD